MYGLEAILHEDNSMTLVHMAVAAAVVLTAAAKHAAARARSRVRVLHATTQHHKFQRVVGVTRDVERYATMGRLVWQQKNGQERQRMIANCVHTQRIHAQGSGYSVSLPNGAGEGSGRPSAGVRVTCACSPQRMWFMAALAASWLAKLCT
jgi:hypothetical protein